jgi:hypothetical protein
MIARGFADVLKQNTGAPRRKPPRYWVDELTVHFSLVKHYSDFALKPPRRRGMESKYRFQGDSV